MTLNLSFWDHHTVSLRFNNSSTASVHNMNPEFATFMHHPILLALLLCIAFHTMYMAPSKERLEKRNRASFAKTLEEIVSHLPPPRACPPPPPRGPGMLPSRLDPAEPEGSVDPESTTNESPRNADPGNEGGETREQQAGTSKGVYSVEGDAGDIRKLRVWQQDKGDTLVDVIVPCVHDFRAEDDGTSFWCELSSNEHAIADLYALSDYEDDDQSEEDWDAALDEVGGRMEEMFEKFENEVAKLKQGLQSEILHLKSTEVFLNSIVPGECAQAKTISFAVQSNWLRFAFELSIGEYT